MTKTGRFVLGMLLVGLVCSFGIATAAENPSQRSGPTLGRGETVGYPLAPAPYCESLGGSLDYEYISNIHYDLNTGGTMALTVEIAISNPGGCTYGNPCPEYDNNPEAVNAWIDWNGDGTWSNEEKVLDDDLTGYGDINYFGTLSTSTVFTIPDGAVDTTYLRVNLGWGYDPDDPCTASWSWGDVYDKRISTLTELPYISDIIVHGAPGDDKNPTTGKQVKLEAVTIVPSGFEVTSISWSGDDIPAGATGNLYTYTPAAGTHGRKTVQCLIVYRQTGSGETGEDTRTEDFKLFFPKYLDDNTDGAPNWFNYWKTDGTVPALNNPLVIFDSSYGGGMYGCWCSGQVHVGSDAAEQHYASPIVVNTHFGSESFGGPSVYGIDSLSEVLAHELYHKQVGDNWAAGGAWVGQADSDGGSCTFPVAHCDERNCPAGDCWSCDDNLPDTFETGTSFTSTSDTDTYNLESIKSCVYKGYGDNEYMAMRTGDASRGNAGNDWANPGKQTDPPRSTLLEGAEALGGFGSAEFTGVVKDRGVDTNGDGLYNNLSIEPEIKVISGGELYVGAILLNGRGLVPDARKRVILNPGIQTVPLEFNGIEIWEHGINGPYPVGLMISAADDGAPRLLDAMNYTTKAYSAEQFQSRGAEFTDKFVEYVFDTDNDDYYNYLAVDAGTLVRRGGTYEFEAWLVEDYAAKPVEIVKATNRITLPAGETYVRLLFDGSAIRQHRSNGPWYVYGLTVKDAGGNQIDRMPWSHVTDDYPYTRFEPGKAEFNREYFEGMWRKDTNYNEYADYLTAGVNVNVRTAGSFMVHGTLADMAGNIIDEASTRFSTKGPQSKNIELDFSGREIFDRKANGPFVLKELSLYGSEGILDELPNSLESSSYKYGEFLPLVQLTGNFYDRVYDRDKDGLYDSLGACVEVMTSDDGSISLHGRLMDPKGREIGWEHRTADIVRLTPTTVCLLFDGRLIYGHRTSGEFTVRDLYVYHTGDPYVPDYSGERLDTDSYSYSQFEASQTIYGVVKDVQGTRIGGALVSLELPPEVAPNFVYTGDDGTYLLVVNSPGEYTLTVTPPVSSHLSGATGYVEAREGEAVRHDFTLCSIPVPFPGYNRAPTDPDGDCLFEDVNGNQLVDYDDAVVLFWNVNWVSERQPMGAFDFNANRIMDYDDAVTLFWQV